MIKQLVPVFIAVLLIFVTVLPVEAISPDLTIQTGFRLPFPAGKAYTITNIGSTHGYGRHAIDFSMAVGTQVSAMKAGYVRRVGTWSDGGKYIAIDHGSFCSFYVHLSSNRTSVGNYVRRGEIIALSGNTGTSSGPHLHISLMPDNSTNGCPYLSTKEYPIGFYEYGNLEILQRYVMSKTSQNTLYILPFSSTASYGISITVPEVSVTVCDSSTLPNHYVYATLYRGPVGSYPEKSWSYVKKATTGCVTFTNMDGSGDTYKGVTYYAVISLGPISTADTKAKRTSCFATTAYKQICLSARR
jgi:murein DD-endopeptidase MepM/ murein hydrolase activator NlpD